MADISRSPTDGGPVRTVPTFLFLGGILSLATPLIYVVGPDLRFEAFTLTTVHNILIIALVTPLALRNGLRKFPNPVLIGYLLLLIITFTLSSRLPELTALRSLRSFAALVLGPLIFQIRLDSRTQGLLWRTLPWIAFLSLLAAALLLPFTQRPLYWWDLGAFRLQGATISGHLAYLALVGLLAAAFRPTKYRWGEGMMLANFTIIVWTGSRTATLAALVVVSLYLVHDFRARPAPGGQSWARQRARFAVGVCLALISYSPFMIIRMTRLNPYSPEGLSMPAWLIAPIDDIAAEDAETLITLNTTGRLKAWGFFWDVARQDLRFGRGVGASLVANQGQLHSTFRIPHNEYLRIIVDGGFVGLWVMIVAYSTLAYLLVRQAPEQNRLFILASLAILALDAFLRNPLSLQQFSIPFCLILSLLAFPCETPGAPSQQEENKGHAVETG